MLARFEGADLPALYAHSPGTVRANFVVSLDGAVEVGGRSGYLGGPQDRELFALLRSLADVVLVGAGTARREGYGPAWLSPARRDQRVAQGQAPLPTLAVVSMSAALEPGSRLFAERRADQPTPPRPVVVTCAAAPSDRLERLRSVAEVLVVGDESVDLAGALAALGGQAVRTLCEGGPRLLGDLLAAGLLDELCLTHAPVLAGSGRATLLGGTAFAPGQPPRLRAAHVLDADGMLMARWLLDR